MAVSRNTIKRLEEHKRLEQVGRFFLAQIILWEKKMVIHMIIHSLRKAKKGWKKKNKAKGKSERRDFCASQCFKCEEEQHLRSDLGVKFNFQQGVNTASPFSNLRGTYHRAYGTMRRGSTSSLN